MYVDLSRTKMMKHQAFSGKKSQNQHKVAKSGKKKQPALGLETLSDIALTEDEQIKLAIERSKTQLHLSQPSGSGAHEGTGVTPGWLDVPTYESDDEQISWKSSEEEDDDEDNVSKHDDDNDNERTESDNNDDDNSDEEVQGANTKEEEMVEEATHEEDEANELYRDVNVNLEGRDTVMTDAPLPNVQATQETEDTHVILTALIIPEGQHQSSSVSSGFVSNMLNPRPDTGIDSIFNLNTEATSLVDVSVTTIAEPPLVFATTLPPPPTPLITHMQQTPAPTPTIVPSTSLQDLPNFGSLFGFDHRLKTLETDFFEFKQTNQFAEAVSSIPGIVDAYLANKMNEAVKTVVQLQSNRLRDEAQAKNEDFLNKLDDNIKKIIKDQVKQQVKAQVSKILPRIEKTVNEQLEAEVMTRSSTESKTSLAIAASYTEIRLKSFSLKRWRAIVIRSNEQKNSPLYKGLVEAIRKWTSSFLTLYGDAGVSRERRVEKKPESNQCPKERHPRKTGTFNEGANFITVLARLSAEEANSTLPKPTRPPTPDRDWNKTLPADHGPVQPWLSNLARQENPCESFDELTDTPFDFSAFVMNRLNVETLTLELLTGPTFELMKGTCKSLIELEKDIQDN
ncbi:hypothetical protein Tco_0355404 [Tanacetum coccineum]